MADKHRILAVNPISIALASLPATFHCCGFFVFYIMNEMRKLQRLALRFASQHSVAVKRLRHTRENRLSSRETVEYSWAHSTVVDKPL